MRNFLLLILSVGALTPLSSCNDDKGKVEGTVNLAPELASQISPTAVLYVAAREPGVTTGPPIAVKRFTQPLHFPVEFSLSGQDSMIPDHPFKGRVMIRARISQSGSAIPVQAGDLEATLPPPEIDIGSSSKVTVLIDKKHSS